MPKKVLIEMDISDDVSMGQLMAEMSFEFLGTDPFFSCCNDPNPPITICSTNEDSTIRVTIDMVNKDIGHGKCVPVLKRWVDIIDSINTRYMLRKDFTKLTKKLEEQGK